MDVFKERVGREILFFDGAMGTQIQAKGLEVSGAPEDLNITNPEGIYAIHSEYLSSGADIILANTFGANRIKYRGKFSVPEVVRAGVKIARKAVEDSGKNAYVALDIGATGKLLEPYGDLSFEEAYSAFAELVKAGAEAGADVISIETMMDVYEIKAAILAAKESCSLPITATVSFEASGKTLTGTSPAVAATLIGSLGVDALGINCGLGPEQCVTLLNELRRFTSAPIAVSPNAGLPIFAEGRTVYPLDAERFALSMREIFDNGASILGGCCGTTPKHIRALAETYGGAKLLNSYSAKRPTCVSSRTRVLDIDSGCVVGERLNSKKNPELCDALINGDNFYFEDEAMEQEDDGAEILSVCACAEGVDEKGAIVSMIRAAQSMTSLPLMIEATSLSALEGALRAYNGRPAVKWNEANGLSLNFVMLLAKKYGACVVEQTEDGSLKILRH